MVATRENIKLQRPVYVHMEQTGTKTKSNTEEQIFDAALTIFSRKGKDGARMQEIAEEAGMNKALLHYYFRSKDRLYEAVALADRAYAARKEEN